MSLRKVLSCKDELLPVFGYVKSTAFFSTKNITTLMIKNFTKKQTTETLPRLVWR